MNSVIALVPMKGYSERVPKKNFKNFNGKPLCHWIIKTLIGSKSIKKIYVNTDCNEISHYLQENFPLVKIIKRPKAICGDFVSMNDVIAYDLSQIEGDDFLQTHSTNPMLSAETIQRAVNVYFEKRG